MKITNLCVCVLGELLVSVSCSAMDKSKSESAVLTYNGEKNRVLLFCQTTQIVAR